MMESQVDRELLEKIADMLGKPVGAFNMHDVLKAGVV